VGGAEAKERDVVQVWIALAGHGRPGDFDEQHLGEELDLG